MAQTEFDWSRAEQLAAINHWEAPPARGVSSITLKAVLAAIDSFGRGREAWPSEATIARVAGCSVRTVKRAVKRLEELSLVIVERRGPLTLNHYRIVWNELALLVASRRVNCPAPLPERSATVTERSATVTERSATVTPTKCHGDTLNVKQTKEETTTTAGVVVVSILKSLGIARAAEAYRSALALGMSEQDISQRIEDYQRSPGQSPGVLYNWLTKRGSYRPAVGAEPSLILAKGLEPAQERRRADLIQYGRRQGWRPDQLQAAVKRFEADSRAQNASYV